jgi:hypothetical protein
MRIRFIVTGDLERAAMVSSISRWFPSETTAGEAVEWLPSRKVHAATTHRIDAGKAPSNPMRTLARAAIAEASEGKHGEPADLVVVVDDVELHNLDQPAVLCAHFRAAVEAEITGRQLNAAGEGRLRERVRTRCSFHLLCPMVEAHLFGEPAALVRAGCAADIEPRLVHSDIEAFESCDERWRPEWEAENACKAAPPDPMPWWREQCHAKHYLEHLVARSSGFYDETIGGAMAFATLDWPRVPAHSTAAAYARALFEDISDAIGCPNPLGATGMSSLTYPLRTVDRTALLLRNL